MKELDELEGNRPKDRDKENKKARPLKLTITRPAIKSAGFRKRR